MEEQTVIAKLNLILAARGQRLRKCQSKAEQNRWGRYRIENEELSVVARKHLDLPQLARLHGVLAVGEPIEYTSWDVGGS